MMQRTALRLTLGIAFVAAGSSSGAFAGRLTPVAAVPQWATGSVDGTALAERRWHVSDDLDTGQWMVLRDDAHGFALRYPGGWTVSRPAQHTVVLTAPGGEAWLSIRRLAGPCPEHRGQPGPTGATNAYAAGEEATRVAGRDVVARHSFDTIEGARETRLLVPLDGAACLDIRRRRLERPDAAPTARMLDAILGTLTVP